MLLLLSVSSRSRSHRRATSCHLGAYEKMMACQNGAPCTLGNIYSTTQVQIVCSRGSTGVLCAIWLYLLIISYILLGPGCIIYVSPSLLNESSRVWIDVHYDFSILLIAPHHD
jgi:hypothetical protein